MAKQVNIRSDKAHAIAAKWARKKGQSITATIEQALEAFDASKDVARQQRLERWRAGIRTVQDEVKRRAVVFEIEDMCDEAGLPA